MSSAEQAEQAHLDAVQDRLEQTLQAIEGRLSSDDVLILSPNRVFSDYIADVLPELGEEAVHQVGMEDLAEELLEGKYRFQGFLEQTTELLERSDDEAMRDRPTRRSSTGWSARSCSVPPSAAGWRTRTSSR